MFELRETMDFIDTEKSSIIEIKIPPSVKADLQDGIKEVKQALTEQTDTIVTLDRSGTLAFAAVQGYVEKHQIPNFPSVIPVLIGREVSFAAADYVGEKLNTPPEIVLHPDFVTSEAIELYYEWLRNNAGIQPIVNKLQQIFSSGSGHEIMVVDDRSNEATTMLLTVPMLVIQALENLGLIQKGRITDYINPELLLSPPYQTARKVFPDLMIGNVRLKRLILLLTDWQTFIIEHSFPALSKLPPKQRRAIILLLRQLMRGRVETNEHTLRSITSWADVEKIGIQVLENHPHLIDVGKSLNTQNPAIFLKKILPRSAQANPQVVHKATITALKEIGYKTRLKRD